MGIETDATCVISCVNLTPSFASTAFQFVFSEKLLVTFAALLLQSVWLHVLGEEAVVAQEEDPVAAGHAGRGARRSRTRRRHRRPRHGHRNPRLGRQEGACVRVCVGVCVRVCVHVCACVCVRVCVCAQGSDVSPCTVGTNKPALCCQKVRVRVQWEIMCVDSPLCRPIVIVGSSVAPIDGLGQEPLGRSSLTD